MLPSAPNLVNEASRALPHRVVDGARFGGDSRLAKRAQAAGLLPALLEKGVKALICGNRTTFVRTSDQARGPAEFKHITKRRKRN